MFSLVVKSVDFNGFFIALALSWLLFDCNQLFFVCMLSSTIIVSAFLCSTINNKKTRTKLSVFLLFLLFFFRSTSESRGKSPLFSISQAFWVEKAINFVPQFFFFVIFFHPSHKNRSLIAFVRSHFIWYIWFRNNLRDVGNHPKMLINIFKKCPNRQIAYILSVGQQLCVCVCCERKSFVSYGDPFLLINNLWVNKLFLCMGGRPEMELACQWHTRLQQVVHRPCFSWKCISSTYNTQKQQNSNEYKTIFLIKMYDHWGIARRSRKKYE